MKYTYQKIIEKCQEAFKDIKTFYQADVVNYRGKTSDTNEYYSEVVAKFVLDNIEEFRRGIPIIKRMKPYKSEIASASQSSINYSILTSDKIKDNSIEFMNAY